jgi:hypothetical protein
MGDDLFPLNDEKFLRKRGYPRCSTVLPLSRKNREKLREKIVLFCSKPRNYRDVAKKFQISGRSAARYLRYLCHVRGPLNAILAKSGPPRFVWSVMTSREQRLAKKPAHRMPASKKVRCV